MIQKCDGCGVEKDDEVLEVSPWADEDRISDEPIPPFIPLCVIKTDQYCRRCLVCHACFHRMSPDMWIDDVLWAYINPVVPYESLPIEYHGAEPDG